MEDLNNALILIFLLLAAVSYLLLRLTGAALEWWGRKIHQGRAAEAPEKTSKLRSACPPSP